MKKTADIYLYKNIRMKKIYLFVCLSLAVATVNAQLMTEPFNYTPDPVLGLEAQSGGLWVGVNSGDSILITSGSLSYPGLAASTGNKVAFDGGGRDYFRDFAAQTTGSVYTSFIVNVSALGSLDTDGGYFLGLSEPANTFTFGAVVWVRLSTTAGKYNIGISTRSSSSPVSWLPNELDPGTSYFVVTAYDMIAGTANDVSRIWLNTTAIGSAEPTADATAVSGTSDLDDGAGKIFLRQDSNHETPFLEVDEIRVGTSWVDVTPGGGATPVISASPLTAFGDVCTGTTVGPNSFTISGANLTTANVTVAALNGFTYSTTSGGTYTNTLSLTQPGGTFSQEVFVKFSPTAVQSYDGDIVVAGGGASSINVAASGSGVTNTVPALTTGNATSVTPNSATLAGTITATGCSSITAYGIEYSTTAGFPNGSGTQVPASNLSGGDFSSDLSSLSPATTYYYHAYATNTTGTGYGAEESFTTTTPGGGTGMVISQVYGGGGNSSATYNQDFVELFNRTTAPIDISNWSVQYASSTGPVGSGNWIVTSIPSSTIVPAGKYFLVALATGSTGGNLPTPDLINTGMNLSGSKGKVALVNSTTALNGTTACSDASVVDVLGYGSGTTCAETAVFDNSGIDNTMAMFRKNNGCTDNDDNSNDFELLTVLPRNSTSPANNCGAPSPNLSASTLASFGDVCVNTTAGPNSFTITGTLLTTENITVGALAGYTYATTAGGTYTASLDLTQPGGSFSQMIFVKFNPTAIQSYNGNIAVSGGGAPSINVPVIGAGVNNAPLMTTGGASAVTQTSATLAGTVDDAGCTSMTGYGIEYSTTSGFTPGTGTQVPASNIAGGNFSSPVSGLTQSTTYYYRAYATNGAGTGYGLEQSFTTASPPPPTLTASALADFTPTCIAAVNGPHSFTVNGTDLTTAPITIGPFEGFTFSQTSGGSYSSTLSVSQAGGTQSVTIYVMFSPTAAQSYNGNIPVGGAGAATIQVPVVASGINTVPSAVTGVASDLTNHSATLSGSISAIGCSSITGYGIEISSISGFADGTGMKVPASNISGTASFSSALDGLVQGATYYFKAYATNNGGTGYGVEQAFVVPAIGQGLFLYPVPAIRGQEVRVTMDNIAPGNYSLQFFNSVGQLTYQWNMNIQVDFINQTVPIPESLQPGTYHVVLVNHLGKIVTKSILIM